MEILNFYGLNILAGALLTILLGMLGTHAVARNQSLDVMLLGQEFQTAILVSALVLNLFFQNTHDDHGLHLETLISLSLVVLFHFFFFKVLKNKNQYKTEASIVSIVLLMAMSQLVVSLSPSIEFHMVKSFIGDIVTVSRFESIAVSVISILCLLLLIKKRKMILKDSLELALFNKITTKRLSFYLYNVLLLISMLLSIHLFGSLFTIGSILIPNFICTFMGVNIKETYKLSLINWISVPVSFSFLTYNDRIPTTVMITLLIIIFSICFCFIRKRTSSRPA